RDAAAPSSRNPDVPPELDRIVGLALKRDPGQRYARASELARDLSRWLASAAPGFTREDVAALVHRVVPEKKPDLGRAATELATPSSPVPKRVEPALTTPLRIKPQTRAEE